MKKKTINMGLIIGFLFIIMGVALVSTLFFWYDYNMISIGIVLFVAGTFLLVLTKTKKSKSRFGFLENYLGDLRYIINKIALFTGWVFIIMCLIANFNPIYIFDYKYQELEADYHNTKTKLEETKENLNICENITHPRFVAMVVEELKENK